MPLRRGDSESERRALEDLIASDPADFTALDRLADLLVQNSQPARATELRRQKMELERLRARYQKLYQRSQPTRDAAEMGRLAAQLGRWFEAKAFLTIATASESDRDDLQSDLARVNLRAKNIGTAGVPVMFPSDGS